MNLEQAVQHDHEARIHRPPGSLPDARRAPLRRLRHASVFELRGHRLWPEDAEVLRQPRAARVRLDLRLRAQSRTRLSRASSGDLRGDRRARQPASPAAWRASRARTSHASGRHSGEPGQRLDVVPRREGRLLLGARNRERRLSASDRPPRRSTARSALPGSPADRRPSIRPRRLRLPVCRPDA